MDMQRRPQAEERERKIQVGGNVRKRTDRTVRGKMHEKGEEQNWSAKGKQRVSLQ